jgi:hypothetical protein
MRASMKKTALAALLAGAGSLSCTSYEVDASEAHLRYDPASDTLTLFEIDIGLSSTDAKAPAAIEKLLAGQRQFPPEGGLLCVDFDQGFDEEDRLELADLLDRFEHFSEGVSVDEVGLFLDRGRLCLYRRSRFRDVKLGLVIINALINRTMQEEFDLESRSFPVFDPRTAEAWFARARAGGEWIRIEEGAFVIDLPMTAENAARCLEHLADPGVSVLQDAHWLLRQLTRLELQGDSLQLHFAGGPDGWMRFDSPGRDRDGYHLELLDTLRASGHDFSETPSLAEVRAQARGH